MKKQSFITGALILMIANAISKILGAVFKIPLAYILHEEGMAIYNTAFGAYILVLSPVISGLPFAVSRLTAEEFALKRCGAARKTMWIATAVLLVLGAIGSILLYLGADFFAAAMRDPKAAMSIRVISPAVFLVAAGAGVKSYFQGASNMVPTAVSQVIEAFVKLFAGYAMAVCFAKAAVEINSAGAITGVTAGEFVATVILLLLYIPQRKMDKNGADMPSGEIVSKIFAVALPMTFLALVANGLSMIDTTMVRARLSSIMFTEETARRFLMDFSQYTALFDSLPKTMTLGVDGARWLWGAYSGYALTLFHLPVGILATLAVTVLPVIAGAWTVGDRGRALKTLNTGLKITSLFSVPCAAMVFVLSREALDILFRNTASAGMLMLLAPCLVMMCVEQFCVSVQQSAGMIWRPFFYMLISYAVKIALLYFLVGMPQLHILGAVISAVVCAFLGMCLNLYGIRKYMGLKFSLREILLKPVMAGVVMTGVMKLLYEPVQALGLGSLGICAVLGTAGMLGYFLALICMGVKLEKSS